jgi:hypothetical protein
MNSILANISIGRLAELEGLSVRVVNSCIRENLTSLDKLLEFYKKHGSFQMLYGCGDLSNTQLTRLCNKYEKLSDTAIAKKSDPLIKITNSFTPLQKEIFDKYFIYLFTTYQRSEDPYLNKLIKKLNKETFLRTFKKHRSFSSGISGSNRFIYDLKRKLFIKAKQISQLTGKKLKKECAITIVRDIFIKYPDLKFSETSQFINKDGKIKIFKIIDFLLKNGTSLYETRRNVMLRLCYNDYKDETLESIAKELGRTRERIRQLKVKLSDMLNDDFAFLSEIKRELIADYGFNNDNPFNIINNKAINIINKKENINFNLQVYTSLLAIIYDKTHKLLNPGSINIKDKSQLRKKVFTNSYLIKNEYFESFDFEDMVEDLSKLILIKPEQSYSLNFHDYVREFTKDTDRNSFSKIYEICLSILKFEFNLKPDRNNLINFRGRTKNVIVRFCYDYLNSIDKPCHVNKIYSAFTKNNPDINIQKSYIRVLMADDKRFIYFGRNSTYGLKKWEKEKFNVKGGTIRNIVSKYLQNKKRVMHISEIIKEVIKYRPETNEKNVLHNLILDGSFKILPGGFVSHPKFYKPQYNKKYIKLRGIHFSKQLLKEFNGKKLSFLIETYEQRYGYHPIQIKHSIQNNIAKKRLRLLPNNEKGKIYIN